MHSLTFEGNLSNIRTGSTTEEVSLIINVSGASGTGKSCLVERLVLLHPDRYSRLITSTTRPMRPGEVAGVSYHFVPYDDFEESEYVLKRIRTEGVYAVRRKDLDCIDGKKLLTTFPPRGIEKLEVLGYQTVLFHLHLSERIRIQRMKERGDGEKDIQRRIQQDKGESTLSVAKSVYAGKKFFPLDAQKSLDHLASEIDAVVRKLTP